MEDILAKKNRHLFLEEKDNTHNSFISNINYAVENIDTIKTFNDNVNSGTMRHLLETYIEQVGAEGNAWVLRLTELGENILTTTSGFNYAAVLTASQNIEAGATITLPEAMKYRVGTHMLLISWNGTVCYNGDQYEEIGAFNEKSTTIKIKQDIKTGDKLEFRTVALADNAAVTLALSDVIDNYPIISNNTNIGRTITERFSDVINVRDFGAKGDGVTDDTDAIQAAMDYAFEIEDHRPVVGFGTFLITKTLVAGPTWSIGQRKRGQEYRLGTLICGDDTHLWQSGSSDPAINFRAWCGLLQVDEIQCNYNCAGILVNTYGGTVYNSSIYNFAPDSYGLMWTSGGNIIINPKIQHTRADEASNYLKTPGILCKDGNSSDSKVFGGIIGNCSPGIWLKQGASLNFFHGMHIYSGSAAYPVVDPVLIRTETTGPNYIFNSYYDSGHIDCIKQGLKFYGGHYYQNNGISTVNGSFIRWYPDDNSGNYAVCEVCGVQNASVAFLSSEDHAIPSTHDYSAINAITLPAGQEARYERTIKYVFPNSYNQPFEEVYKPVGILSRFYKVGSGSGVRVEYDNNAIRIKDPNGGTGARLRLGDGSAGIGENPDAGGQAFLYANSTIHLELAGESGVSTSGHVRPGVDNFDTLGTSGRRWKELFCANSTINTSDERMKQQIADIPEVVFRAWSKVKFQQYKWNDAVETKGEAARFHTGAIAQRIVEAFQFEGLDAMQYGLICYDEWPAETHTFKVVDKEAVVDEEDRTVEPEVSHVETIIEPAGNRYSLRYSECLCLEAAYQRWLGEQRDAKIEALMQRISALENNH